MSFIGIVSGNKSFETLKEKLLEIAPNENFNLININLKSIENVKNIKFETIIINEELKKFKNNISSLEQICENSRYIIINTDINCKNNILNIENYKEKVITFGLNTKAILTISSITENHLLICLQKSIKNIKGNMLEIGEKRIKLIKNKIFEVLIIYIIISLYEVEEIEKI